MPTDFINLTNVREARLQQQRRKFADRHFTRLDAFLLGAAGALAVAAILLATCGCVARVFFH